MLYFISFYFIFLTVVQHRAATSELLLLHLLICCHADFSSRLHYVAKLCLSRKNVEKEFASVPTCTNYSHLSRSLGLLCVSGAQCISNPHTASYTEA